MSSASRSSLTLGQPRAERLISETSSSILGQRRRAALSTAGRPRASLRRARWSAGRPRSTRSPALAGLAPRCRARPVAAGSPASCPMLSASATGSPGETSTPSTPSRIMPGMPPTRVATTAQPGRHVLEHRQGRAFAIGREHRDIRQREQTRHIVTLTQEADSIRQPSSIRRAAQDRPAPIGSRRSREGRGSDGRSAADRAPRSRARRASPAAPRRRRA